MSFDNLIECLYVEVPKLIITWRIMTMPSQIIYPHYHGENLEKLSNTVIHQYKTN